MAGVVPWPSARGFDPEGIRLPDSLAAKKAWITGTSPVMTIKTLLAIRSAKPDGLIAQTPP
jgi:hypothetical protein